MKRNHSRSPNTPSPVLLPSAVLACALAAWIGVEGGVKYGDAVPGVVNGADLARLKRALDLDRFSVIAAVRLGAEEGREAVIAEPLDGRTLALVKEACARGGFCPDRLGFVASRVRILLLHDNEVLTALVVDQEIRGSRGRLVDLREVGTRGRIIGWSGWPEAEADHVALALTPIVETPGGRARAGSGGPLRIQWNEATGRFQLLECEAGEGDDASGAGGGAGDERAEPECRFEDEAGG